MVFVDPWLPSSMLYAPLLLPQLLLLKAMLMPCVRFSHLCSEPMEMCCCC